MPSPIRLLALAALLASPLALSPATAATAATQSITPAPLQQLRIMARHGFAVRSIWRSEHRDKIEFVYLLDWPDAAAMKAAWDAFMADPEWAAIKKETGARHGRFVDAISDRTLEPVPWSPDRADAGG